MGVSGRWIAIVGAGRDGRADVVETLAERLRGEGVSVGGFLQRTVRDVRDEIVGYDVVRVPSGEARPLARESAEPELCRWSFDAETFATARGWTCERPLDAAFVEAGRLEAAERGHWPTILEALRRQPLTILCVRRGVLAGVALKLPDPIDGLELPAGEADVVSFHDRVLGHLRRSRDSRA